MATLTADMLGSPTDDLELTVTYNSATLVASSVHLINRSQRTYTLTLTSTAPVLNATITVVPGTNQTITIPAGRLTLVATAPGDDGQSGVTWPPTLTVSAGTVSG